MQRVFSDFAAVERHLDALGLFHMDLGLGRVERALAQLNLERMPYAAVQIAGTNGKGSVAAYVAGLAQARGLDVGLYTSPHFVTPRERVRVNGRMLDEDAWTDLANRVYEAGRPVTEDGSRADACELTYFEFLTVLAALAFAEGGYDGRPVDLAVFECGLGGTYDATTALRLDPRTDRTLFTRIGLDHQKVLGDTLAKIAHDKAGAMRPGVAAWTVDQHPETMAELLAVARDTGASLRRSEYDAVADALAPGCPSFPGGPHQAANARLAIAAFNDIARVRHWRPYDEFDAEDILALLDRSRPAGRFQKVYVDHNPQRPLEFILDGAHNEDALRATRNALAASGIRPRAVVFTCLADKDLDHIVPLVAALSDGPVHVPEFDALGRERPAAEVAQAMGPRAHAHPDVADAVAAAQQTPAGEPGTGPVLVCGSLYLLAQFYTLRPDCLE